MQQTATARVIQYTTVILTKKDSVDNVKVIHNTHLQKPSLSFIEIISAVQAKAKAR